MIEHHKQTKDNENKLQTERAAISQKVATQQLKLNQKYTEPT